MYRLSGPQERLQSNAVPGSSFFREDVKSFIRFHFAKEVATLQLALEKLEALPTLVKERYGLK